MDGYAQPGELLSVASAGMKRGVVSGMNLSALVDAAHSGQRSSYSDLREKTTRYIVFQLDRYLRPRAPRPKGFLFRLKSRVVKHCCLVCLQLRGSYLVICYLISKLAYIGNAIGQLYMLDLFLGADYHFYGIEVMRKLIHGDDWSISERFPRVTLCNFNVRRQTKVHTHIVQCALPINLFNEKLFIFIWFWFVLLAVLSAYSFVWWCWHFFSWPSNHHFIKYQVSLGDTELLKRHKQNLVKFVQYYLQRDGVFVVRLVAQNAGTMASAELATGLWENYGPGRACTFNIQLETASPVQNNQHATHVLDETLIRKPNGREDI